MWKTRPTGRIPDNYGLWLKTKNQENIIDDIKQYTAQYSCTLCVVNTMIPLILFHGLFYGQVPICKSTILKVSRWNVFVRYKSYSRNYSTADQRRPRLEIIAQITTQPKCRDTLPLFFYFFLRHQRCTLIIYKLRMYTYYKYLLWWNFINFFLYFSMLNLANLCHFVVSGTYFV